MDVKEQQEYTNIILSTLDDEGCSDSVSERKHCCSSIAEGQMDGWDRNVGV